MYVLESAGNGFETPLKALHSKWRFCMTAMLHGRNNENGLHKKGHFFPQEKNLFFLPCNMAAMQILY